MENNDILEALESAEIALIGYVGDITIDKRLTWVYGILVGWNDESLKEYAERHNVSKSEIRRLKEYRNRYVFLKKKLTKKKNTIKKLWFQAAWKDFIMDIFAKNTRRIEKGYKQAYWKVFDVFYQLAQNMKGNKKNGK